MCHTTLPAIVKRLLVTHKVIIQRCLGSNIATSLRRHGTTLNWRAWPDKYRVSKTQAKLSRPWVITLHHKSNIPESSSHAVTHQ